MTMARSAQNTSGRAVHYVSLAVFAVFVLFLGLVMLGCIGAAIFAAYRSANKEQVAVAGDGSCQVALPAGWVKVPHQGQSILAADGLSGRATFDVYRIAKADLAPNDSYREHGARYIQDVLRNAEYQNPRVTRGPIECVVNNRPALEYEMEGVFSKQQTRFVFFIRVIDGERSVLKAAVSLPPSEVNRHRTVALSLLNSVKELP